MPRFDDCCNQEETVQFDCPCTINIPTAIPSVSLTFDLNLLTEQTASFTGNLDFQCCDGNHILQPSAEEHTLPLGFTITYDVASSSDGSYGFTIHFTNIEAYNYLPSQATFTIYYTICGVEIPLTITRTFVNNCIIVYPDLVATAIEMTTADDGTSYDVVVDFESIECCGITSVLFKSVVILGTDIGVTLTSPPLGFSFSGQGSVTLSFLYLENGSTGYQTFNLKFLACGLEFIKQVNFHTAAP